ncbi:MAG: winged helix-turn-helix domain-containing protein [Prosthecobacter sp.]
MPASVAVSAVRISSRYRVYRGEEIVLGPGKAQILALIAETGSLSEAARRMDMSYNRAWLHVKVMNESFAEPLVNSTRGGAGKGGAELTDAGREVLELYRRLEDEAAKATAATQRALAKKMKPTG